MRKPECGKWIEKNIFTYETRERWVFPKTDRVSTAWKRVEIIPGTRPSEWPPITDSTDEAAENLLNGITIMAVADVRAYWRYVYRLMDKYGSPTWEKKHERDEWTRRSRNCITAMQWLEGTSIWKYLRAELKEDPRFREFSTFERYRRKATQRYTKGDKNE